MTVLADAMTLEQIDRMRDSYRGALREVARLKLENEKLHGLLLHVLAANHTANQEITVALAQIRREAKETR